MLRNILVTGSILLIQIVSCTTGQEEECLPEEADLLSSMFCRVNTGSLKVEWNIGDMNDIIARIEKVSEKNKYTGLSSYASDFFGDWNKVIWSVDRHLRLFDTMRLFACFEEIISEEKEKNPLMPEQEEEGERKKSLSDMHTIEKNIFSACTRVLEMTILVARTAAKTGKRSKVKKSIRPPNTWRLCGLKRLMKFARLDENSSVADSVAELKKSLVFKDPSQADNALTKSILFLRRLNKHNSLVLADFMEKIDLSKETPLVELTRITPEELTELAENFDLNKEVNGYGFLNRYRFREGDVCIRVIDSSKKSLDERRNAPIREDCIETIPNNILIPSVIPTVELLWDIKKCCDSLEVLAMTGPSYLRFLFLAVNDDLTAVYASNILDDCLLPYVSKTYFLSTLTHLSITPFRN